jgi:hypothetical protein
LQDIASRILDRRSSASAFVSFVPFVAPPHFNKANLSRLLPAQRRGEILEWARSRFDSKVPGVSASRSPIAVFEAVKVSKDGQRVPLHFEIGTPTLLEENDGVWCCPILLHGVDTKVRQVDGDDSMQALCFAIRAVFSQLRVIEELGGRIVDEEGNDFPLDAYWR